MAEIQMLSTASTVGDRVLPERRDYQRIMPDAESRRELRERGFTWVLSSNVSGVQVDGRDLVIRFHNASIYRYPNQGHRFEDIIQSPSKGRWVWNNLRRAGVPYSKIGALPLKQDTTETDEEIMFPRLSTQEIRTLLSDAPDIKTLEDLLQGRTSPFELGLDEITVEDQELIQQYIESKTKEEAMSKAKEIGVIELESNIIKSANEDVLKQSVDEINKVVFEYPVLKGSKVSINMTSKMGQRVGGQYQMQINEIDLNKNRGMPTIEINTRFNKKSFSKTQIIEEHNAQSKNNWLAKVDDDKATAYTTTHEYGHHIQNDILFKKDYLPKSEEAQKKWIEMIDAHKEFIEVKKNKIRAMEENLKKVDTTSFYGQALEKRLKQNIKSWENADYGQKESKIVRELLEKQANEHRKEVFRRYEKILKDEGLTDVAIQELKRKEITKYGATSSQEFFAETFAESRLNSKPTKMAEVFKTWLDEKLKSI